MAASSDRQAAASAFVPSSGDPPDPLARFRGAYFAGEPSPPDAAYMGEPCPLGAGLAAGMGRGLPAPGFEPPAGDRLGGGRSIGAAVGETRTWGRTPE